jgi:CRISPR-associated protein Csc3
MTEHDREIIDELATRAFDIARPTSFKPYAVERVFRESVKAVTDIGTTRPGPNDSKRYVAGRVRKLVDRSEQVYPVSNDKASHDGDFGERVDRYADYFVEHVLFDICDGKPSQLKRLSNNFADGFYAATLALIRNQSDAADDDPDESPTQTTLGETDS